MVPVTADVGTDVSTDRVDPEVRRGPRIAFGTVALASAAVLLVSRSGPGRGTYNGLVVLVVLLLPILVVTWFVAAAARADGASRRLLIGAPVLLGLFVVPLAASEVPSALRWQSSRYAFDDVIARQPRPASDRYHHASLAIPAWIGSYKIRSAEVAEDLTIFVEDEDAVIDPFRDPAHGDRRGFVHTASGNLSLFDFDGSPELRPLGDGWYSFQAASITGH